jgi:hypothetical protein
MVRRKKEDQTTGEEPPSAASANGEERANPTRSQESKKRSRMKNLRRSMSVNAHGMRDMLKKGKK